MKSYKQLNNLIESLADDEEFIMPNRLRKVISPKKIMKDNSREIISILKKFAKKYKTSEEEIAMALSYLLKKEFA